MRADHLHQAGPGSVRYDLAPPRVTGPPIGPGQGPAADINAT
ncbi:hypothetical protein BX264_5948 [Streptomyces sp. 2333.5]|nr:hypothetical protein BX264_5948 [Streptomyces sp. 2333.5]SEE77097.1 hypothetical protein SAMN05428943_6046 [Streptomyces sp. 2314.4]SEE99836.1 hypothetical protein SAMN05428942_6046 [Streptomyces sp. 2112.2]